MNSIFITRYWHLQKSAWVLSTNAFQNVLYVSKHTKYRKYTTAISKNVSVDKLDDILVNITIYVTEK